MTRYVRFWMIGTDDKLSGVRGYCDETQDRYELTANDEQHPNLWSSCIIIHHQLDDGWGCKTIATGTLFECMVATENHAKASADNTPSPYEPED